MDCSLLGSCGAAGVCACRPGWTGASCARADLLPLDVTRGYQNATASSWGGIPVLGADGRWHMFLTEMANQCPLLLFEANSMVVRAVSTTALPDGPYVHEETVLPPFHHNPTVVGPTPDGFYLMFFIGADNQSFAFDCTHGGMPPGAHPARVPSNNWISMAWARDPVAGPWEQRVVLDNTHTSDQSVWDCESQNPTAHVLANGTVVVVYRGNNCDHSAATLGEHLGVAVATNWTAPFVRDADPIVSPQSPMTNGSNNEDAFLWQELVDGSWHIVDHQQGVNNMCGREERGSACAAHFFSRDPHGPWRMSPDFVYSPNVMLSNGSAAVFQTRQRPQLLFDKETGAPTYLITGGSFDGDNGDENITTHTFFQQFRGSGSGGGGGGGGKNHNNNNKNNNNNNPGAATAADKRTAVRK
jgi:hypothetical protein